jgi:hypothetical protein
MRRRREVHSETSVRVKILSVDRRETATSPFCPLNNHHVIKLEVTLR